MEKMDMVLTKEEMYKRIWLDYFDCPRNKRTECFIYRYLKKAKTKKCKALHKDMLALTDYIKQKRTDKYTTLKSTRLAFENNVADRDFFIGIISKIADLDISDLADKSNDELKELSKNQEEKLLFGCITDFFQNSGFRFKKKESDKKGQLTEEEEYQRVEVKYKKKQDGYISDLDMWADFFLYENNKHRAVPDTADFTVINDEYIEKCEKLYEELVSNEQEEVIVPLCFDVRSGAGIYIFGRNSAVGIPEDKPCSIFVTRFFQTESCDYENNELNMTLHFQHAKNIHEAFDLFHREGKLFFENYAMANEFLPEDVDNCFRIFFEQTESKRAKELAQKLIERQKADLARGKELDLISDESESNRWYRNICKDAILGKT